MGAHFSIDVDEIHMFSSYEWLDLAEPCDHDCQHRSLSVIAWGPTTATYELEECGDCRCRAWQDGRWTIERARASGHDGFWMQRMDWRKVHPAQQGGAS